MAKIHKEHINSLKPLEKYLHIKISEDRLRRKLKIKI